MAAAKGWEIGDTDSHDGEESYPTTHRKYDFAGGVVSSMRSGRDDGYGGPYNRHRHHVPTRVVETGMIAATGADVEVVPVVPSGPLAVASQLDSVDIGGWNEFMADGAGEGPSAVMHT